VCQICTSHLFWLQGWPISQSGLSTQQHLFQPYVPEVSAHVQHATKPTQHLTQLARQVISLAVTLASDSRILLPVASSNNTLPSPGSSHTPTQTVFVHSNSRVRDKSMPGNVQKHQKPKSDDNNNNDLLSMGMDMNVPQPNPNQL
jgi:hypothetical protein